jgi:hypothetical protein
MSCNRLEQQHANACFASFNPHAYVTFVLSHFPQHHSTPHHMLIRCPAVASISCRQVNASETVYQNYQKLTLQETPGSVPAGRLPRHKEVILLADLIDCARPGEEIEVTGALDYVLIAVTPTMLLLLGSWFSSVSICTMCR